MAKKANAPPPPVELNEDEAKFVRALVADRERNITRAAKAAGRKSAWGSSALKKPWVRREIENVTGLAFKRAMRANSQAARTRALDYVRAAELGDQTLAEQRSQALAVRSGAIADATEVMEKVTDHLRASMGPFIKAGPEREIELDVLGAIELNPGVAAWIKSIQTDTEWETKKSDPESQEIRRLLRQKVRLEIVDRQRAAADMAKILGMISDQPPQGRGTDLWARVLEQLPPDTVKNIHLALLRASAPPIDIKAKSA